MELDRTNLQNMVKNMPSREKYDQIKNLRENLPDRKPVGLITYFRMMLDNIGNKALQRNPVYPLLFNILWRMRIIAIAINGFCTPITFEWATSGSGHIQ